MNYFQLYGLPVSLHVDREMVRRKYAELSRRFLSDYLDDEDPRALKRSAEVGAGLQQGLRIFSSREETIRYVLQLKGLLTGEEEPLPGPGFLMQLTELKEAAVETTGEGGDPARKTRLLQQITELEEEIYAPVQDIVEHYQEGVTSREALLQVKEYFFQKKYLQRLRQQLVGKL